MQAIKTIFSLIRINENTMPNKNEQRVIRISELMNIIGTSRSSVWRWVKDGDFPAPLMLGPNSVGWLASEVYEWLENRPRVK